MPKFPEPPREVPSTFGPNGGNGNAHGGNPNSNVGSGNKATGNDDLDFDALAKRFEELKKKL